MYYKLQSRRGRGYDVRKRGHDEGKVGGYNLESIAYTIVIHCLDCVSTSTINSNES